MYRPSPTEILAARVSMYDLDHLATFTVNPRQGLASPADGIKRLRQMEMTTGVWTMRVQMVVEGRDVVIIDRQTGEEMERFPLRLIVEPTAVTNNDRRDIYNNIILFVVEEDQHQQSPAEMHIFQSTGKPAHIIVDDVKEAKAALTQPRGYAPARRETPAQDDRHGRVQNLRQEYEIAAVNARRTADMLDTYQPAPNVRQELQRSYRPPSDAGSVVTEKTDAEVQLLNRCFDDIERFVGHLQHAADAFKELDRRVKSGRGKNRHGDGMLTMRARPPPAKEFVDIFQKFKVCFNLLAKLKPVIHDPNAPELVHFLFTPLSLVVEASKDPRQGTPELAAEVVSPLLTPEAKDLLLNCLSSKEADLWTSLGDAWTVSRDDWKGYVPPYLLRFSDGWQPHPSLLDDMESTIKSRKTSELDARPAPVALEVEYAHVNKADPYRYQQPPPAENPAYYERNGYNQRGPPSPHDNHSTGHNSDIERRRGEVDRRDREMERDRDLAKQAAAVASGLQTRTLSPEQEFVRQLRLKDAKISQAQHDREGANQKELTVKKGEVLEVVDDSRNWWKMRNAQGGEGFVPYTILESYRGSGGIPG